MLIIQLTLLIRLDACRGKKFTVKYFTQLFQKRIFTIIFILYLQINMSQNILFGSGVLKLFLTFLPQQTFNHTNYYYIYYKVSGGNKARLRFYQFSGHSFRLFSPNIQDLIQQFIDENTLKGFQQICIHKMHRWSYFFNSDTIWYYYSSAW